ncbi:TetR/AcrR family transcriptional regulator [Amycolatopsis acidicola]|uniref:TetR/AcrR family transcriptional regulator n=1 Tax=Amycolatopsis acidicola TaxID=2596893 RepID=A0A5N0V4Z4_9PSEU|nr:TetR/AcrR family transcriptional regulator [Amycolatopsis acidicola]KAA9161065.1 TetR/AcrR family transcriptional regulator [Amycolatopsis acidicola]
MLNTRARILDTAQRLFAEQGYQHTSVRQIAERLGLTKTAVLYHFPAKVDILLALAEPFLADLEAAVGVAEDRWGAIEGLLEAHLKHRHLLHNNVLQDLAMMAQESVARRYARLMLEANRLVAGPGPDFATKVQAAQAIAMLSDPVIIYADAPIDDLRAAVLAGVKAFYSDDSE